MVVGIFLLLKVSPLYLGAKIIGLGIGFFLSNLLRIRRLLGIHIRNRIRVRFALVARRL